MTKLLQIQLLIGLALIVGCQQSPPRKPRPIEASISEQIETVRNGTRSSIRLLETQVEDDELAQLADLSGLEELIVDHGVVTDEGLQSIASLTKLRHVRLRKSPITDTGLAHLAQIPSLRVINIPHGEFTDEGIRLLKSLPSLEQLRLSSPNVSDKSLAAMIEFPNLRRLHLIDVNITDAGLLHVTQMEKLESFYLDGASVSHEAIVGLFDARPDLHIHLDQKHHDRDPNAHAH